MADDGYRPTTGNARSATPPDPAPAPAARAPARSAPARSAPARAAPAPAPVGRRPAPMPARPVTPTPDTAANLMQRPLSNDTTAMGIPINSIPSASKVMAQPAPDVTATKAFQPPPTPPDVTMSKAIQQPPPRYPMWPTPPAPGSMPHSAPPMPANYRPAAQAGSEEPAVDSPPPAYKKGGSVSKAGWRKWGW